MSEGETEEPRARRRESSNRRRRCYAGNFGASVPNQFAELLLTIVPAGSPRSHLVDLFDGRATWQAIYDWRRGKAKPPAWAIEQVRRWFAERAAKAAMIEPSPGKEAGWKNIQGWKAKQNAGT